MVYGLQPSNYVNLAIGLMKGFSDEGMGTDFDAARQNQPALKQLHNYLEHLMDAVSENRLGEQQKLELYQRLAEFEGQVTVWAEGVERSVAAAESDDARKMINLLGDSLQLVLSDMREMERLGQRVKRSHKSKEAQE